MLFENHTPFPAIAWENVDTDNSWHITTVARVKYLFDISDKGICTLRLDPNQGELWEEDIFYGDANQSSIRYESDYVTYKPVTDIIINAYALIPANQSQTECKVTIMDGKGNIYKQVALSVSSPYKDTDRPVALPIRYEYAKGGGYPTPAEDDPYDYKTLDPYNPIGIGVFDEHSPNRQKKEPLILFSDPKMQDLPYPAGFGVIYRAWRSRLEYAGTYDDNWLTQKHPLPPDDFDYRFNQAANPALQLNRYIDLHHRIVLENFSMRYPVVEFRLPDLVLFSQQHTNEPKIHFDTMYSDTVLLDMEDLNPDKWRLYVSYRSFAPRKDDYRKVSCRFITKELLAGEDDG